MFTTAHPYDLVIGLDRSDRKADLGLIDTHTAQHVQQSVDPSPESLQDWLVELLTSNVECLKLVRLPDGIAQGGEEAFAGLAGHGLLIAFRCVLHQFLRNFFQEWRGVAGE